MPNRKIHIENSAYNWENASPVGCGSAGMMIFGGVDCDKLALNEESIWAGGRRDTTIENFDEKIAYIRQLFINDREEEADGWAKENMKGCFSGVRSYEYAGNLFVKLADDDSSEDYSRDIELENGLCAVKYKKDGISYSREYFASYPRRLLAAKYSTDARFSAVITYERENLVTREYSPCGIAAVGVTASGDHRFAVNVKIVTDGVCAASDNGTEVKDATSIILYIAIASEWKNDNCIETAKKMLSATDDSYEVLKKEHIDDFSALMNRSHLDLGGEEKDALTIGERLEILKKDPDAVDNGLISLYWMFGKYLLISSSRRGTLPANLQGVWADGLTPPWNSDYHTNINLQMNYWQAEEANISECTEALFDYMNECLLPGGKNEARINYKTRGMVVHHLSDIYGFASVADGLWGLWPLGGAWLAYHMWEHYLYTGDKEFLRNTAYEYIRECVLFFEDNLFPGKDGYMHTGPSTSPENSYFKEANGKRVSVNLAISPAMDIEIVGGLFDFYVKTEEILGLDPENAEKVRALREKLPPLRVGKRGQLMEWLKDYDECEPGHRHISHAFALYPAAQISRNTPELFAAIEKTLELRLASGGGHAGWSRAWLINLFARLGNAEKTYENIRALFTRSTLPNLLDTHAPFQIDGNFGGGAGIGEMLMQSHDGYISILPAAHKSLSGSFDGFRARGGVTVSAKWENGEVKNVVLVPDKSCTVKLRIPGHDTIELELTETGKELSF